MTSRDIVFKSLKGEKTPRPACGPLAVHFCATDNGVSIEDFTLKPSVHADCILRYHEKYQPDAVWISADTWVTAEAMGASVDFPDNDQPMSGFQEGFIHSFAELKKIPKPDPYSQGRQPLMLEALSRVVETLGKEVFIVGCFDQSPFSLACQVAGMASVMTKLTEDLPFLEALMEKCLEYSLAYAKAMAESGADMAATGADVMEIDHQVSIGKAWEKVGDRVALWGNIDPVAVLLKGSSHEVSSSVRGLISEVKDIGCHKFILSSGCTIAPTTPSKNLHAFVQESRTW